MFDKVLHRPKILQAVRRWPRWRHVLLAGALVYAASYACSSFRWWRPERAFNAGDNQNIAEARSWLRGRLDLIVDEVSFPDPNDTGRPWDTAWFAGRVYNHLPPLATLLFAPLMLLFDERVPHVLVIALTVLAMPALALRMFLNCTERVWPAALLTLAFMLGTSILPVAYRAATVGHAYYVNQLLATNGLLVFLGEYFGRRRICLAGIGLIIAFWSRQLTLGYTLPFLWMAGHADRNVGVPASGRQTCRPEARTTRPRGRVIIACLLVAGMLSVPLLLNWLKFRDPFQSGYAYIYVGRNEAFARDAQYGIFSPHFVPRNLYWMNVGLPRIVQAGGLYFRQEDDDRWDCGYDARLRAAGWMYHRVNHVATGIWWTTPLLLYLFVDGRRIWRDPARRMLLLAAALVYVGLLLYHGTGRLQSGYNRYSLDYLPPLFAIIAPQVFMARRQWITLVLIGWSILYFQWLIPQRSAW
ncbi:MAG TPA: hypothetical protein VGM03_05655 [Phycisphaerae bacterium]